MAKLTNKQKGYLVGAGALGLFLLYGSDAKAKDLLRPDQDPDPDPDPDQDQAPDRLRQR